LDGCPVEIDVMTADRYLNLVKEDCCALGYWIVGVLAERGNDVDDGYGSQGQQM
jgi:hypothetical protein